MQLIVHMGFHKTGSTYLQHLLNDNHDALVAHGIYYQRQAGYPAHHFAAWDILRGDASPVATMIAEARARGCHTTILSSEDLEGAIFNLQTVAAIEAAAAEAGVRAIEWHICVRDPGAYFGSLHAQLQHHVYADPLSLFYEAMRDGLIFIADPLPGERATPYWCYCFDQYRYIANFAAQTAHPVVVHDFADRQPFPGWRLLGRLGALGALGNAPGPDARNARLDDDQVLEGYARRIESVIPDDVHREKLLPVIRSSIQAGIGAVASYAEVVGAHFASSHAQAIADFGPQVQVQRAVAV